MFRKFWKWLTANHKLEITQDAIYKNMWEEINAETEAYRQLNEDNKNISDNLRLAGFELSKRDIDIAI